MRSFILALGLAFASAGIGGPAGPGTLQFEIVLRKDSALAQRVLRSFERAFSRHGIVLQVQEFPSQRGILELRRGRVDGTIGRVGDLERLHGIKDYIRLNVPLMVYTVSMWCTHSPSEMKGLKNPRVAYFPGNIFAMRTVQLIQDRSVAVAEINSFSNLIRMLQTDRLDCLIASDTILDKVGVNPDSLNAYPRHQLIAAPAYPWLARKYKPLAAALEKDLQLEQHELFLRRWQEDIKPGCVLEFNRICPDGRIFTKGDLMPDQEWSAEPWEGN